MNAFKKSLILLFLMSTAAASAYFLRPTQKIADAGPSINLETLIPAKFGDWTEQVSNGMLLANPQQIELLNKIYNQTLSRTYRNNEGNLIMLSIAYGGDQSDGLQLHKPEVCYPAQGFEVVSLVQATVQTETGTIPVVRMEARQGARDEMVTYWTTIGNKVVQGKVEKKLVEMSYGLTGKIPDGILFRVSSLDEEPHRAYSIQEQFIRALLSNMDNDGRRRLIGN